MTAATLTSLAGGHLLDQADRLRSLVHELAADPARADAGDPTPHTARVIAVASGKGGVGKTNISVNVALAMAQSGWNTTLLDGDLGLGNADLMLGLAPRRHLGHVLDGRHSLDEVVVPVASRLRLVPGASGIARLADLDEGSFRRLLGILRSLETTSQVLIIDCGAGIGSGVLSLVASADVAVIVTTPEPTAIADSYALVKCLVGSAENSPNGAVRLGLVINQAHSDGEGRGVHARVAGACEKFLRCPLPLLGIVPTDAHFAHAVRDRRPLIELHARSSGARAIRDLSASLCAFSHLPDPCGASETGLVRRLLGRLGVNL